MNIANAIIQGVLLAAGLVLIAICFTLAVRDIKHRPKPGKLGGFPQRDAAAVLSVCLHRGLTEQEADQVWLLVNTRIPAYPSVAAKQIDDAITSVRGTMTISWRDDTPPTGDTVNE